MKDNRTIDNLGDLIITSPIQIGKQSRSVSHCEAISKSKKKWWASEAGLKERKLRSERTKEYWASEAGQAKKERLRAKYKGVKKS